MRPFRLMRLVRRNLAAHRRSNLLSRSRGISMSSAPGSWPPPGLQGVNVQGALKVHRRFADGTEAGQKARSVERPTCAVLLRVIQRRAVLISASVYPSRPRSVVDFFALGSLVARWQPRRDCSAGGGQAKQLH